MWDAVVPRLGSIRTRTAIQRRVGDVCGKLRHAETALDSLHHRNLRKHILLIGPVQVPQPGARLYARSKRHLGRKRQIATGGTRVIMIRSVRIRTARGLRRREATVLIHDCKRRRYLSGGSRIAAAAWGIAWRGILQQAPSESPLAAGGAGQQDRQRVTLSFAPLHRGGARAWFIYGPMDQ